MGRAGGGAAVLSFRDAGEAANANFNPHGEERRERRVSNHEATMISLRGLILRDGRYAASSGRGFNRTVPISLSPGGRGCPSELASEGG